MKRVFPFVFLLALFAYSPADWQKSSEPYNRLSFSYGFPYSDLEPKKNETQTLKKDPRVRNEDKPMPWANAIAKASIKGKDGKFGSGTAVLISSQLILTSQHLVEDAAEFLVFFGYNNGKWVAKAEAELPALASSKFPGLEHLKRQRGKEGEKDWALLKLKKPIDTKLITPVTYDESDKNEYALSPYAIRDHFAIVDADGKILKYKNSIKLIAAGYSGDKDLGKKGEVLTYHFGQKEPVIKPRLDDRGNAVKDRQGYTVIDVIDYGDGCDAFEPTLPDDVYIKNSCIAYPGSSGGPVFAIEIVDGRKIHQLIGIITGGEHRSKSDAVPNGFENGEYTPKVFKTYFSRFDYMAEEVMPFVEKYP